MASGVSSGIRRKVDDLGRVVIPAGIRRTLNIREGDTVEVSVDGERVVLAKPRDACVFCGREGEDLHSFRSRLLCRECLATISGVDTRLRTAAASDGPSPTRSAPQPEPHTTQQTTPPPAGNAPPRGRSGPTPAPGRAAPIGEPPEPPPSWPTGPIDGDALARELAGASSGDDPGDDQQDPDRRRPPYDPASTTAW